MNKIVKVCCISIIVVSLLSVVYFFYLKKDYQENGFPNIISTNVKYNNNIITVRYILNEPNLNHNNF